MRKTTTKRAEIEPVSIDIPPELIEGLTKLVTRIARDAIREAMGGHDPDPYIPHTQWPLPRKQATRHAREIEGSHKVGRIWYARRTAVDAFISSHVAPTRPVEASEDDAIRAELRALGFGKGAA